MHEYTPPTSACQPLGSHQWICYQDRAARIIKDVTERVPGVAMPSCARSVAKSAVTEMSSVTSMSRPAHMGQNGTSYSCTAASVVLVRSRERGGQSGSSPIEAARDGTEGVGVSTERGIPCRRTIQRPCRLVENGDAWNALFRNRDIAINYCHGIGRSATDGDGERVDGQPACADTDSWVPLGVLILRKVAIHFSPRLRILKRPRSGRTGSRHNGCVRTTAGSIDWSGALGGGAVLLDAESALPGRW